MAGKNDIEMKQPRDLIEEIAVLFTEFQTCHDHSRSMEIVRRTLEINSEMILILLEKSERLYQAQGRYDPEAAEIRTLVSEINEMRAQFTEDDGEGVAMEVLLRSTEILGRVTNLLDKRKLRFITNIPSV